MADPTNNAVDSVVEAASVLKASWVASGLPQAALADACGVSPAAVRQWVEGMRPVPASRAMKVAELLGVDPRTISPKFADIARQLNLSWNSPDDDRSTVQELRQDVEALRLALLAVLATSVTHRPAETESIAQALRRSMRKELLDRETVRDLFSALKPKSKA